MPLYDYVCRDCGRSIEVMHGVDATGPASCDNCGGPMRKALSPIAVVFKGSGWAKKERANSSSKSDGGAAGGDAAPTETADKTTSASKSTSEPPTSS